MNDGNDGNDENDGNDRDGNEPERREQGETSGNDGNERERRERPEVGLRRPLVLDCGQTGSDENGSKFDRFGPKGHYSVEFGMLTRLQDVEPKLGFVRLFDHDANSCNEVFSRAAARSRTVVRRDSGAGSQQLWPDKPRQVVCAKFQTEVNDIERELPGPGSELISNHAPTQRNSPAKSEDARISRKSPWLPETP